MKLLTLLIGFSFFSNCGYETEQTEVIFEDEVPSKPNPDQKKYAFSDFNKHCFTCHNSSAPSIPLDEVGFKASAKVKARIQDGTMPPNYGDFDKVKALEFLR